MDDLSMGGSELIETLDEIAAINRFLGGNRLTLNGVKKLIDKKNKEKVIIADVGCGNGDMLRMLADYARKNKLNFSLIGIDANPHTIDYAVQLSVMYPEIEYKCIDIFSESFNQLQYDIVLCTLTLHHFTDDEISGIIATFNKNAARGIVINDLQRSKIAYTLFNLVAMIFRLGKMARQDGAISILRGFTKKELGHIVDKLKLKKSTIRWKWAFRYQWIISKV